MDKITVADLMESEREELDLDILVGLNELDRSLDIVDINRPGLALSGYLEYFAFDRVQVLGNTEIHFMRQLDEETLRQRLDSILNYAIPCFIITRGLQPPQMFLDLASARGIPVIRSNRTTTEVISKVIVFLVDKHAPRTTIHGGAVDVYGVGVLLTGKPGIGKSETALELVERGHRLVADDVVIVQQHGDKYLYAECSSAVGHHMEIRGIGIIDVQAIFGARSVRETKRLGMVVALQEWSETTQYERIGIEEQYDFILGVRIPRVVIPVRPGRNIAIIVEVAALNERLKDLGTHSALALNERIIRHMVGAVEARDE